MSNILIDGYKRVRSYILFSGDCHYKYAFIGAGQHSLYNLYPVIHHLQVPLKYICVTSKEKAELIEKKYIGVKATTDIDMILADSDVKGVFLSVSPKAHFQLAVKVLSAGKSLFVEKPPCSDMEQLQELQRLSANSPVAMVGLQKRYSPVLRTLRKRLAKERVLSYSLKYLTGAYPEGNALLDLFIHPLDMVRSLFGDAEVVACRKIRDNSYMLMLQHGDVVGVLELSTCHSWANAMESLDVCTASGSYCMTQMEQLTFTPKQGTMLGVPLEKVFSREASQQVLFQRNNFSPLLANNQIYTQGFYGELSAFVDSVEKGAPQGVMTSFADIAGTYELMEKIHQQA